MSDWFAKWEGGTLDLRVGTYSSFWITKLFESFASRSFDHPKGDYIHDLWEDVFSSYEGSVGKLLAGHLLGDGSQLGDDVSEQ